MKTKIILLLLIISSGVLLTGCSIIGKPAGLKVETDQPANVFIDGKIMGKTPYENSDVKGKKEITLKIIPEITERPLVSWESKVKLLGGTWTSVKRELAATETDSSGQLLYMEKNKDEKTAAVSIVTDPAGAAIVINQEEKGVSPFELTGLTPADYTIEVRMDGFVSRNMKLRLLAGYRLIAQIKLGQVALGGDLTSAPPATVSGQPTVKPTAAAATVTPGKTTPAPTKPVTTTVTPTKAAGAEPTRPYVLIKDTEVGFLRVREKPSTTSTELAQVKPGEKYALLGEENGWYKISYQTGKEGWVAGQYVTKYE